MKVDISIIEPYGKDSKHLTLYAGEHEEGTVGLTVDGFSTPIESVRYFGFLDTLFVVVKELPERIDYDSTHKTIYLMDSYHTGLFPNGFALCEGKSIILWTKPAEVNK